MNETKARFSAKVIICLLLNMMDLSIRLECFNIHCLTSSDDFSLGSCENVNFETCSRYILKTEDAACYDKYHNLKK